MGGFFGLSLPALKIVVFADCYSIQFKLSRVSHRQLYTMLSTIRPLQQRIRISIISLLKAVLYSGAAQPTLNLKINIKCSTPTHTFLNRYARPCLPWNAYH